MFVENVRHEVLPICYPMNKLDMTTYDKVMTEMKQPENMLDLVSKADVTAAWAKCHAGNLFECGQAIGSTFAAAVDTKKDLFLY